MTPKEMLDKAIQLNDLVNSKQGQANQEVLALMLTQSLLLNCSASVCSRLDRIIELLEQANWLAEGE